MRRGLLVILLGALWACADPDDPDGGPSDAGDGGSIGDLGLPDGGSSDLGPGDTGDTGGDGGGADLGPGDGGGSDGGGGGRRLCGDPYTLDGLFHATLNNGVRWTLLPRSATPTEVTGVTEADTYVAGGIALVRAFEGFRWRAQISHLTRFDMLNYEHFIYDPSDGAFYAVIEQQMHQDGTALRFYSYDDTLAVELLRGGTPGQDLIGQSRQSNFVLIKYTTYGQVAWVSRFGPNLNTDRAGAVVGLGLTPTGVRVVAQVEDNTQVVFAPGTGTELTYDAPAAVSFWAELSKEDGSYVNGTFRRFDTTPSDVGTALLGFGDNAHSATGETAFAGFLPRNAAGATFTLGAPSSSAVTLSSTIARAVFGKIGVTGQVAFAHTAWIPDLLNGAPQARAVGIGPDGTVVVGGQFPSSGAMAAFSGASGGRSVRYASNQSFAAAYSPTGDLLWVRLLGGSDRNAVSRILVTSDGAYVLGSYAAGNVLGQGDPNETTLAVNAYVLAKYDLTTGALAWAQAFTSENGMSSTGVYQIWAVDGRIVAPASFNTLRVVGPNFDQVFDAVPGGSGMTGILVFGADGRFAECQALATFPGRFRPLPLPAPE